MDAYQQPHGYMMPPHTAADPQQHHFHHGQPPPRPPGPPPHDAWFSNQFQYHPSQTPSPPPQQWGPPPPPQQDHFASGSYHQPSNPYPPHYSYHQNQFPPPPPPLHRPHVPSQPYPPHSHVHQPFPQANQNWGTPNWGGQQSWDYSAAHKGEEDWAARARAWADARVAMDAQHPQSQFTQSGKSQEQAHYHDQYIQSADSHYPDTQNQSLNAYHHFSASAAPTHNSTINSKDTAFMGSDSSSYAPDGHGSLKVRDGIVAGEATVMLQLQGCPPASQPNHLQELPSSYSSVAGKEEVVNKSEQSYTSFSNQSAPDGQYPVQPPMHSHYMNAHQLVEPVNPADQPLEFTHRYNHVNDPQVHSSYAHHNPVGTLRGINPVSPVPPINNWASSAVPASAYSSISPVLSSGPLHDPSVTIASSVPGHLAPPFGTFSGPGLPPPISSLNGGTAIPPTSGFPGDAYGISGLSERPKKASVPNWLRDEIKKAVITGPSMDHHKEETQSMGNEVVDKSHGKGDQADSKSIDSSRSTEEEEEEEDNVEAARTAAINQEIKRVLTEVLLKVTDELFDEIATKVIDEDEMTVDDMGIATSNHKVPPAQGSVLTPKASAKVLIPSKAKDTQLPESGKSDSSAPGDLLGLASYASDADEDNDIQSPILPISAKNSAFQQSSNKKPSGNTNDTTNNGTSDLEDSKTVQISHLNDEGKNNLLRSENQNEPPADRDAGVDSSGKVHDRSNSKDSCNKPKSEPVEEISELGKKVADPQGSVTRIRSDKADQKDKSSSRKDYECDKSSSRKESKSCVKEDLGAKMKVDEKGNGNQKRHDEKHLRKEKADGSSGLKEKPKEHNIKHREKARESESRKGSIHVDVQDDRTDEERVHRGIAAEGSSRKKERARDKFEDSLQYKDGKSSGRHKRRRSSSLSRGRSSRDGADNYASDSSEEGSDCSKRKRHSRKHDLSPSPIRSRRRHVSRSPPSKHSQRRHSPYSSLEGSRRKRSRSRSPVPRKR